LLFMDTASQIKIHNITWWVVPEVAAREHANVIFDVLENVLKKVPVAKTLGTGTLDFIDYIAVTKTPWLMPSLLTGLTVARTLWNILKKQVIEINHIEAHIFANYLERKQEEIKYPLVCLTVSWGHNELYFMENMFDMKKLGWTTDDASWEAFDKVAKMMWLWYPGWPIISKLSWEYSWISKNLFPRVWLSKDGFDFSFSGLKSAVKREVDKRWDLSLDDKREISYEFENAVIEVLAYKLINAAKKTWVKTVMLAWWVSANDKLIQTISSLSQKEKLEFIYPKKKIYSWDNAAMVGINGFYKLKKEAK
jgi:N6-L-threonylcarbamoyladenine synthase